MKKGWVTKRLGDVGKTQYGLSESMNEVGKGFKIFRMGEVQDGQLLDTGRMKYADISRAEFELYKLQAGDVLFNRTNSFELVGKTGIFALEGDYCFASYLVRLLPDRKKVVPEFLNYFMNSEAFQKSVKGKASQSTNQANINATILSNELISFPESLAEQQRVVGLLDEAFEGLATAKANAEKNLQNARALFESHLQSVFTQRGPGWVKTTLGEVIEIVGGSQPPKSVFSKTKKPDNIRLIQIRDYKSDKHVVFIPRDQARRFCNADDVMIGRYGPPLFQILRGIEGAYNVALMKAVPDEAKLSRDFLFYFLKHSAILQYVIYHSSRAAGQIGVTKETLEPYPIALPSLEEQRKVVETFQELETETQRLARLYERKHAALEALKKSLLHQAFTGEL